MFSRSHLDRLHNALSEFSLDKSCSTTNTDLPSLYHYLEFYGFLYTIKGLSVEYFCGYRLPKGKASRWGRIATHYWRNAEAKGTVVMVHGLYDHIGLFQPLVRKMLLKGYSVLAIDLPGHGLSDGEPTVIGRFEDYAEVLSECVEYLRPQLAAPVMGLGQSTGCAVLMAQVFTALKHAKKSPYERMVFFAPLIRSRHWKRSLFTYRLLSPFLSNIKRIFSDNSHDKDFNQFLENNDILQAGKLSVRWVTALVHWVADFKTQPSVETPTLILQGTGDTVVDWEINTGLLKEKFTRSELIILKDAMHHLANESQPWRDQIDQNTFRFLAGE
jgi:alpha-beta hydrolase superfamily lysophospholipase